MINNLTGLVYGIIVVGIFIGVGTVVLFNLKGTVAQCGTGFSWNSSLGLCRNSTGDTATATGQAYSNTNYVETQLGSSGIAGWLPAVIAVSIGVLFLGAFALKGRKGKY